jgi:hypothetical protein
MNSLFNPSNNQEIINCIHSLSPTSTALWGKMNVNIVSNSPTFEMEKQQLIDKVQDFVKKGPSTITQHPQSFFGKLTATEWDKLQWKHLDHHLHQFSA